jgi:hypothetical protein
VSAVFLLTLEMRFQQQPKKGPTQIYHEVWCGRLLLHRIVCYHCTGLTGMVNYSLLDVGDPLAFVFAKLDLKWMSEL